MKVAVIGATGKAGSLIAAELLARGHEVAAVARPGSEGKLDGKYPVINKDLFDLGTDDLKDFDAVVSAFGSASYGPGNEGVHVTSMKHLISVMEQLPEVRLLVVGGASSLYKDDRRKGRLVDDIPEGTGELPKNQCAAYDLLKESKVNWTFFSPACKFVYDGEKTGRYILGTDYKILNASGESMISYADYAIAMADEVENGKFIRKRFTAVSDTSLTVARDNLYDLGAGMPFMRSGAYFGVYADEGGFRKADPIFGGGRLALKSRRSIAANKGNLFKIYPVYNGVKAAYSTRITATEMELVTAYGSMKFTWPDDHMLYIKGENGLCLKIERNADNHEIMKPRKGKAWECVLQDVGTFVFNPLKGDIDMNAVWDNEYISTPVIRGLVKPDENGEFLLAVDESLYAGIVRDAYPTYEEALEDVSKDWNEFLSYIPHFNEELEASREFAAYTIWSLILNPSGRLKKPVIFMSGRVIASSWQMSQNAVALQNNMRLAADLLLSYFYEQSPQGQIADFIDESMILGQGIKPPIQGWAIKQIMKKHDLAKEMSKEDLVFLYEGVGRWGMWFMNVRDDDNDGIPQWEHGDECGFDDSTVFVSTNMVESPDLCAYLGLLFEAEGDMAKLLGKEDEAAVWYERSKTIIDKMIETFWNGEMFIARVDKTHEPIISDSLLHYIPLILGKRLPSEIVDKMTADLLVEGEFLTPYGLASEKLTSTQFRISGFARGFILPPYHLYILTGMFEAGKTEEAKMIAMRYLRAMQASGFNQLLNPVKLMKTSFVATWPACAYLTLADMVSNM